MVLGVWGMLGWSLVLGKLFEEKGLDLLLLDQPLLEEVTGLVFAGSRIVNPFSVYTLFWIRKKYQEIDL